MNVLSDSSINLDEVVQQTGLDIKEIIKADNNDDVRVFDNVSDSLT